MRGCSVYLGRSFVSFGRELGSLSRADARLFYGIDIFFGEHGRTSCLWYCRSTEWLLQLHKVQLDPLPPLPEAAAVNASGLPGHRWPGRPRYLGEGPNGTQASGGGAAADAGAAGGAAAPQGGSPDSPIAADHQLSLFFSNADGHVGLLGLPVPQSRMPAAAAAVASWAEHGEVPLTWGGRQWRTAEDFAELRETALNMPDLLLMGLETEVAMALTPDWTWEKYPRGFGEAAFPEEGGTQEGPAPAEAPQRGAAPGDAPPAKEEDGAAREGAAGPRAAPRDA